MDDSPQGTTPGIHADAQPPYQPPVQAYIPSSPPPADSLNHVTEASGPVEQRGVSRNNNLIIGGISLVATLALLVILTFNGDLGTFLQIGVLFVPLALLAALAYAGRKNVTAMVFSYIVLAMVGLGVVIYSLTSLVFGYIADWDKFNQLASGQLAMTSANVQGIFAPSAGGGLLLSLLLYFVATLLAASMLFRPVRVLVAKVVPIDPDNFVHKIASISTNRIAWHIN